LLDHVVLESECIDRMYLNVYVPQLQRAGGVVQGTGPMQACSRERGRAPARRVRRHRRVQIAHVEFRVSARSRHQEGVAIGDQDAMHRR
jgi:hypothetical protein